MTENKDINQRLQYFINYKKIQSEIWTKSQKELLYYDTMSQLNLSELNNKYASADISLIGACICLKITDNYPASTFVGMTSYEKQIMIKESESVMNIRFDNENFATGGTWRINDNKLYLYITRDSKDYPYWIIELNQNSFSYISVEDGTKYNAIRISDKP